MASKRKGAPTIDQGVIPTQSAKVAGRHGKKGRHAKGKKHGRKALY